ncbi:MAG TPA: histidine kinase [Puia sp.]|nr:histidine kinase [Puia sp.]
MKYLGNNQTGDSHGWFNFIETSRVVKTAWLYIMFFMCAAKGFSQAFPDLHFFHLTDREGLSDNNVSAIAQDQEGIIWIGTHSGLNRFDGYGFKRYYYDPNNPSSISNNYIAHIVPDGKNNLWVSTSEGFLYFNTMTQRATRFPSHPDDSNTIRNQYRPFIFLDSARLPWIVSVDGLYQFTDSMHYVRRDEGMPMLSSYLHTSSNRYFGIFADRKGQLWARWTNMLLRLDNHSKKVLQVYKCPEQAAITQVFFDRQNRCWVSTWGKGIYLFTPEVNKWESISLAGTFSAAQSLSVILGAAELEINGRPFLVFSSIAPGLYFIDEENLKSYSYLFDGSAVSIQLAPFVDRQNILWVLTTNGVYYATPSNYLFSVLPVPALKDGQFLGRHSFVYNMRETDNGYWLSKRGYGGVWWYNKNWELQQAWFELPVAMSDKFSFMGKTTREAFDFRQLGDDMFISTEGGLSILDLRRGKWSLCFPPDMKNIPRLRTIVPVSDQEWWIRSYSQGIFIFDPHTRKFIKQYRNDDSTSPGGFFGNVNYLLRDKSGRTFVTTDLGLFRYDEKKDGFTKIFITGQPTPGRALYGMIEDEDGLLWIGADNGLFACNPDDGKIRKAFLDNGNMSYVFRICTDNYQNVWFNSNSGYWCWLRKPDKLIHFENSAGLPKNEESIFYRTSDGAVYAGGKDAVIHFFPEHIMNYRISARTRIIEAMVNDSLLLFTTGAGGEKKLTLLPDENNFQVNFDVINYDPISTNQYYYKLVPGDKDWKQTESGHLVFYNLQPGSYRLETRGASIFAGNFTNTDVLSILVEPHWYQSTWFRLSSLLLAVLFIIFFVRYRISVIRKEAAFKEKIKEVEMTALRAQMNPHFIFNSLNSIENFIMQNEKRLASDYLNKFARLIRMILESSRKQVVPLAKDMDAIRLYVELEQLRFNHTFRYVTDIDQPLLDGDYRVPPLLIQPFVENAIVHGLAPSDRKDLFLRIAVKLRGEYVHYCIENNGIGREESMSYADQHKAHESLGLQITRERIEVINRQQGASNLLEISDLYDEAGNPCGTKVLLTIKPA